jgi:UDP-N-acetylglucosamine:LPS N-acetylglucosamine transferase
MISRLINYLRVRVREHGFNEFLLEPINEKERNIFEEDSYKDLSKNLVDCDSNAFIYRIFQSTVDRKILRELKLKKLLKRRDFYLILILRRLYYFLDSLKLLFFCHKKYYLLQNISGNIESTKVIITMTKNKQREKNLSDSKNFKIIDLLVSNNLVNGYAKIDCIKIGLKTRLKCFLFKIRYPFIESSFIIEFNASKILFEKKLSTLKLESVDVQVFIREGIAHATRALMQSAKDLSISCIVYYQRIILGNTTFIPRESSKIILISQKGLPEHFITHNAEVVYLNDNPYISWRNLSATRQNKNTYGLLAGDENSRYLQQNIIDKKILDLISKEVMPKCIIRPHPQEMTKPHRVEYYQSLITNYDFVEINTNPSADDFLEQVDFVITYVNSTLVDEALLCKRPVIVVKKESETVNQKTLNFASDFCFVVDTNSELQSAFHSCSLMSESELDYAWNLFLEELNFNQNYIVDIDNMLMA